MSDLAAILLEVKNLRNENEDLMIEADKHVEEITHLRNEAQQADARIAELEATVAKAFLRCQALEEAVKPFAIQGVEIESADDIYVYYRNKNGEGIILPSVQPSDFSRARDVLCHAAPVPGCETSSAEEPPQSDDGEAR